MADATIYLFPSVYNSRQQIRDKPHVPPASQPVALHMLTIYHNPRCSKSRQTLALLQQRGIEPQVVLYLQTPPDAATLAGLLQRLGLSARQLLRRGEQAYADNHLQASDLSEAQLLEAMVTHPQLIERPIVVKGDRAVLGRPPENVLALL